MDNLKHNDAFIIPVARTTSYHNSCVSLIKLWNKAPQEKKNSLTLCVFKKSLKKPTDEQLRK